MSGTVSEAALHPVRRLGTAAIVLAQLSLVLSGTLHPLAALVLSSATIALVEWAPRRGPETDQPVRIATTAIALIAVALALLSVAQSAASGDPRDVAAPLRGALPLALIVIGACHASTWRRLRDVMSGLLVAFGLLAMAAVFASGLLPGSVALAGGVAVLAALVLVRQATVGEDLPMAVVHVTAGRRARRPVAGPVAIAAVVALGLSLLTPFSSASETVTQWAESRGLDPSGVTSGTRSSTNSGRASGPGSYTGGVLDMRMRGELPATPLLRVDDPRPRLWRAAVYGSYTGTSWVPALSRDPVQLPYEAPADAAAAATDVVTAERLSRRDTSVYAPGDITALSAEDVAMGIDNGNGTMSTAPGTTRYTADIAPVRTLDEATAALQPDDGSNGFWTTLPDTVPERVRALGLELSAGSTDPRDKARAIEAYLAANATYRLDSPVPARGEDAVDVFLFRDKVGFCEQFAAAETVLLRSAGVPARVVTGLAYGEALPGGGLEFKGKNLHAWVELWVPGTGWVSSDPTAGAALDAAAAESVTAKLRRWWNAFVENFPGGRIGIAVTLLALVVLVVAWLAWRRRRPATSVQPERVAPASASGPATAAYRRLLRRLPASGGRLPQETVREHGVRLGRDPALANALVVVEEENYAGAPPEPARSDEAAGVLDAQRLAATTPARRRR